MAEYHDIRDLATYTTRMSRGVMDKLFFVDKIEPQLVVDFGCADGAMLEHLAPWYPQASFVGYDLDRAMLDQAASRLGRCVAPERFALESEWPAVAERVRRAQAAGEKAALVLSSIVHEVYHYQEPHEVDCFWRTVFHSGFDVIVLRDMIPSRAIDRPADVNDVARVYQRHLHTSQLQDFETCWGSVENNRNLVHFLLKHQYVEPNWAREVKENYLPLYREDLLAMIPRDYTILYHEHFTLPYLKRVVRATFGIELRDPTHLKLILERTPPDESGRV